MSNVNNYNPTDKVNEIEAALTRAETVLGQGEKVKESGFIEFFTKTIPNLFARLSSTETRLNNIENELAALIGGLKSADTTDRVFEKHTPSAKGMSFQSKELEQYLKKNYHDPKDVINEIVLELDSLKEAYAGHKTPELRAVIHQMLDSVSNFVDRHKSEQIMPAIQERKTQIAREFLVDNFRKIGFINTRKINNSFRLRINGITGNLKDYDLSQIDQQVAHLEKYREFENRIEAFKSWRNNISGTNKGAIIESTDSIIDQAIKALDFTDNDAKVIEECSNHLKKIQKETNNENTNRMFDDISDMFNSL
ncbi:MAG: hypothetical protein ACXU9U_03130 [Parachlamydiaceae bacterium]